MLRTLQYLVIAAMLVGNVGASAQEGTRFRSGVDLVALNVVATDGQGKLVGGLRSEDFVVLEDGHRQEITFFAATPVPIDLAILLDTSASMSPKMGTVQEAAIGFTSAVRPGDRVMVVDIKDSVRIIHPLDENVGGARAAIRATTAGGNTSLYNGLYMTLKDLMKQRVTGDVRRQAIVVLSDGADTSSLVSYDDLNVLAKQAGVAIYTIMLRSTLDRTLARSSATYSESEFSMKELAMVTGARAFFPTVLTELAGVYGTIADELASQYSLGYSSSNPHRDTAYRRIDVRIDRPGIRARTRTGYLAAASRLARAGGGPSTLPR